MGFLDFLRGPDMDGGLEQYRQTPGALLLDVRTPAEYEDGHIPGARNLPLQSLNQIGTVAPDKNTPLFLYCRSGARSGQAARLLQSSGYTHVTNLGGTLHYHHPLER